MQTKKARFMSSWSATPSDEMTCGCVVFQIRMA